MVLVQQQLGVSERRACRVLGQTCSTQRREPKVQEDEEALREDMVKLARQFGRYGYRMITGMLRAEGWPVNHKRVERIWRQEGLKVPTLHHAGSEAPTTVRALHERKGATPRLEYGLLDPRWIELSHPTLGWNLSLRRHTR